MKKVLLLITIVSALWACNTTKSTAPVVTETKEDSGITYTNTIKKLVGSKCIGCHKGYGAGGLNLETFENVKKSAQSGTLLERINDVYKPMPKAGLMSEKNRDLFKKWAANGFAQ